MRALLALAFALVACGGATTHDDAGDDAGSDTAPACTMTQWGCSFCVGDASDACGNIGRYHDDGTIELGCCLGGAPVCRNGECVSAEGRK